MVGTKLLDPFNRPSGQEMRAEAHTSRLEEIVPVREINVFCPGKQDRFLVEALQVGFGFYVQTANPQHDMFNLQIMVGSGFKTGAAKYQSALYLDGRYPSRLISPKPRWWYQRLSDLSFLRQQPFSECWEGEMPGGVKNDLERPHRVD